MTPVLPNLTLEEAAAALQGLAAVDRVQLRRGVPGVLAGLRSGQLRYIRRDPREEWRSLQELWRHGGGDCEDLAAALAAELVELGIPAKPVVYRVRPGLAHAVTLRLHDRVLLDPSVMGGMNAP